MIIKELEIKEEINKLKKMSEQTKRRLKKAPKGNIIVKQKNGKSEFYYKGDGDKHNGRYLKKSEIKLVKELVQRDYDKKAMKCADERIKMLEMLLKKDKKTDLKMLYERTTIHRRNLIETSIISDEEYVRRWQDVQYEGKKFDDDMPEIYTDRGERVRSKSEKIIADRLNALGIPYRYEYPLVLNDGTRIYPDFLILKMPERKEIYHEHFGMLDDIDYISGMLWKFDTYARNGIYLGVNLFFTYETGKKSLNTKALNNYLMEIYGA